MIAAPIIEEPGGKEAAPEVIPAADALISGKAVKALKMAVFGLVIGAVGFAAGLGVNVREVAKGYIEEFDGNHPAGIMAAIRVLADIDTQCRESNANTREILNVLKEQQE